jgi:IMP dehydrogenase
MGPSAQIMLRIDHEALTFDDVLLLPGYSEVIPRDVSLQTRLTRTIRLNIPLVSAAMDTVTEARLAIALAQEGGIGIVHKSMSIEQQAQEVRAVKKFESGVVKDPITIEADTPIRELLALTREHNISGVPVLRDGDLVGQCDDAARAPGDRARGRQRRGGQEPAPQAPHREGAGGQ